MSKLFDPVMPKDHDKHEHCGALKAMNFQHELDEFTSKKERFVPRRSNVAVKLAYRDKNSCR